MRTSKSVQIVNCHAEGEVGDVITGGVAPPPGDTLWEQSRFIARDQSLRNFLLNEPRGGVFRHYNLLVPPKNPAAAMGFIIMEPEDTPPMSGSNTICVATVLLDTGILPMVEPLTRLVLEAPAGLVEVTAQCKDGKAERITLQNVPSFVDRLDCPLEVDGYGTINVDTAFGGDSFVMADAQRLGFSLHPSEARELAAAGRRIVAAANAQLGFSHPTLAGWDHFSFCFLRGPLERRQGILTAKNACVINPGKLDRSPTGTGCSALMAVLQARGLMRAGERFTGRSIIDSEFEGQILSHTSVAGRPAIIASISGRAWITGASQFWLDPADPWPQGYKVADTWPGA